MREIEETPKENENMKNLGLCLLFILAIPAVAVADVIMGTNDPSKLAVTYVGTQPISPTDDFIVVSEESVFIRGSVADESGIARVSINGETVPVADDGVFVTKISIDYGKNRITVTGEDEIEVLNTHKFTIYHRPDRSDMDFALFFATDTYSGEKDEHGNWNDLNTAIRDAETIAKNLHDNYGFETKVFKNLTKRELLNTLYAYRNDFEGTEYAPDSQLLIYFSGHGYYDPVEEESYLITADTEVPTVDPTLASALQHTKLRRQIEAITCRRILVMLDTDFSGMFDPGYEPLPVLRGVLAGDQISLKQQIKTMLKLEARWYLTSSGVEYTAEGTGTGHTPFAEAFLNALNTNGGEDLLLTLDEVWQEIQKSRDHPIYQEIIKHFEATGKKFEPPEPRKGQFGKSHPAESNFLFFPKPQVVLDAPLPIR